MYQLPTPLAPQREEREYVSRRNLREILRDVRRERRKIAVRRKIHTVAAASRSAIRGRKDRKRKRMIVDTRLPATFYRVPCTTNPLWVHCEPGDERSARRRDAITWTERRNAKCSCEAKSRFPPPLFPHTAAASSRPRRRARSSQSLFRLPSSFASSSPPPFAVSARPGSCLQPPRAPAASFRDYILEIVNRMPAGDAPADIPYISGDPFFERGRAMRRNGKRDDAAMI